MPRRNKLIHLHKKNKLHELNIVSKGTVAGKKMHHLECIKPCNICKSWDDKLPINWLAGFL